MSAPSTVPTTIHHHGKITVIATPTVAYSHLDIYFGGGRSIGAAHFTTNAIAATIWHWVKDGRTCNFTAHTIKDLMAQVEAYYCPELAEVPS